MLSEKVAFRRSLTRLKTRTNKKEWDEKTSWFSKLEKKVHLIDELGQCSNQRSSDEGRTAGVQWHLYEDITHSHVGTCTSVLV